MLRLAARHKDKVVKVCNGIYRFKGIEIMKIDKRCWRITSPGYGNDFVLLEDAVNFIKKGGPPPEEVKKDE